MTEGHKYTSKSMRIQVLMEPELLTTIKTYAVEHQILHRNDSQLIRNVLLQGITKLQDMELTIYILQGNKEERKKELSSLIAQSEQQTKHIIDLNKENEILKKNMEIKNAPHKKKNISKQ